MKKFVAVALLALASTVGAQTITGAGATFPAPVYAKWAEGFNRGTGGVVNYQAIGSGGGVKQIAAKTVDFGATDDPMSSEDTARQGYYQFPTVIGGVVPVVNVAGINAGDVVLDGATLAGIFNGRITRWNDAAVAKLNPKLALPDAAITIVVRADSSGTTAVFTDYLAQVSEEFKKDTGAGKSVNWRPAGTVAGKGNAGVAAMVKQVPGSIGYVEYAYVKQNKMVYTRMLGKTGKPVSPDDVTFKQAANSADWTVPGMAVNLNNKDGWPITAATFILVYKQGNDNTKNVIKFFDWAFANGDQLATDLDYVPLPSVVKAKIKSDWAKEVK